MSEDSKELSSEVIFNAIVASGMELFEKKEYAAALLEFEKLPGYARSASVLSSLALCIAEVRKSYKVAANLCHDAIKMEPKHPEHYFIQGRILLLAGRKKDAIWVLRIGLRHGKHKGIINLLGALGIRRPPPLTFLDRSHPVNKYIGLFLTRLNLR